MEACVLDSKWVKQSNISGALLKLTNPNQKCSLQAPRLTELYHSSCHVASIQNLARDLFQAQDWSWRSTLPWAMQSGPPMLLLENRVTQCELRWFSPDRACWSVLWLSHQTLTAPLHSPACWASCAGERELERGGWRAARSQEHVWAICRVRPLKEGVCACVCVEAGAAVCLQGCSYLLCVITS